MAITVQGFGRRIRSEELELGAIAIGSRGSAQWLIMRVEYAVGAPHDLVLAQLVGEALPNVEFPRLVDRSAVAYTSLDGRVFARPVAFAVPDDEANSGALVIDGKGEAFVRKTVDGVDHFSLSTGRAANPENRTYYANWEFVQVFGEEERVIVRMAQTPIKAPPGPRVIRPPNPGVV